MNASTGFIVEPPATAGTGSRMTFRNDHHAGSPAAALSQLAPPSIQARMAISAAGSGLPGGICKSPDRATAL